MTVSSMHCCKSAAEPVRGSLRRSLWLLAVLVLIALPLHARAGTITPVSAHLSASDDSYLLSAEFKVDLGPHLEEVVSRGMPLYFLLEFNLTRNRWYWANEHIASKTINYRLSYDALTRQYRLANGPLYQSFASLGEALRVMSHVFALPVVAKSEVKEGDTYQAELRLSLDRQQLPKPFQVDAIANSDWQVDAQTLHWQFVPGAPDEEHAPK